MRKIMVFTMTIILLLSAVLSSAYGESDPFESLAEFRKPYRFQAPVISYNGTLEDITANNNAVATFIANAWTNLLVYEITGEGKKAEETFAAEIYEAMVEGPGEFVFIASDPTTTITNVLVARNNPYFGDYYWIEWDIATQAMKAMKGPGVEHYAEDNEFLADYVFSSILFSAARGDVFTNSFREESLIYAFGSRIGMEKLCDKAYESCTTDGSKNPLSVD